MVSFGTFGASAEARSRAPRSRSLLPATAAAEAASLYALHADAVRPVCS
jgi:hypothetical protein